MEKKFDVKRMLSAGNHQKFHPHFISLMYRFSREELAFILYLTLDSEVWEVDLSDKELLAHYIGTDLDTLENVITSFLENGAIKISDGEYRATGRMKIENDQYLYYWDCEDIYAPYCISRIYALTDPRDNKIYYVGISGSPNARLKEHLAQPISKKMGKWIEELKQIGLTPGLTVLRDVLMGEDELQVEKEYIYKMIEEGHPLLNRENKNAN